MVEECQYCERITWCERRQNGKWQCLACKVERFFEIVLFPPLKLGLVGWQRKVLRDIYGNVDPETGLRRYRRAYISVPKKNGKSFLIAGLPIYHMLMEGERNPNVYGAAVDAKQARIVYGHSAAMIRANPALKDRFRIIESSRIIRLSGGEGFYQVLASSDGGNDGIEPSLNIMDELHEWRNAATRKTYTNMTKGTISRQQPLSVEITTAGEIGASELCQEEHEMAERIIAGTLENPRVYAAIWAADKDRVAEDPNYWQTRAARVAANPSHEDNGGFLRDSELAADAEDAVNKAGRVTDYLRYNLNIWVSNEERYIKADEWARGAQQLRSPLIGKPCWVGLDLATTIDLASVVAVFPSDDGSYDVLPFFFMARGQIVRREKQDRVPYSKWEREGFLNVTEGDSINRMAIREHIRWLSAEFRPYEICFDPWQAQELAQELSEEDGMTLVKIPQGYAHLSEPIKKIKELCIDGRIRHADHPILKWNADCASVKSDGKDNVIFCKPDRQKNSKRIDGMAAMANAFSRAILSEPVSVYEKRGIISL